MVVRNPNIHNIMGGMECTGVRLHNHRRKLKQRFDIIRKLGQGTYGKVQLGINKETGQEVAIKTIKKAKIETEADLIRIRREIQIMSSVQHPNIIHIYEVFENREKIVLVMEYAAGGELYDYLSERKVLSEDEARRIFGQITIAVYYCHKHKICHRDLKLENILLDEHGNAKIADFGLSNVFDEIRLLNTFCGSPLYASPEIVKGTPYYGPEVDCWSLGVLLYTLVYGAMPFDGSNFKRLVKQISRGDYFEPKKASPASSLIKEMLTVPSAQRANILRVCSHWWVNEGQSKSFLETAEELVAQTPVRLDLLLTLAPTSKGVNMENVLNQESSSSPTTSLSDIPVRCRSMGSLMELNHNQYEKEILRKQLLHRGSVPVSSQFMAYECPVETDAAKRKLEEGVPSCEAHMKGSISDDVKDKTSHNVTPETQILPDESNISNKEEMNSTTNLKLAGNVLKGKPYNTKPLGETRIKELTKYPMASESMEVGNSLELKNEATSRAHLLSSASVADSTPIVKLLSGKQLTNEDALLDQNKRNMSTVDDTQNLKLESNLEKTAVSKDSEKGLKKNKSKDSWKDKATVVSKDGNKSSALNGEKRKKIFNSNSSVEIKKGVERLFANEKDNGVPARKFSKSSSNSGNNGSLAGDKSSSTIVSKDATLKRKNDVLHRSLISLSDKPSTCSQESNASTAATMEEKVNNIPNSDRAHSVLPQNSTSKSCARDKPNKIFIPGVKVSDFKRAFERKLSSPDINVVCKRNPAKPNVSEADNSYRMLNFGGRYGRANSVELSSIHSTKNNFNSNVNHNVNKDYINNKVENEPSDEMKNNYMSTLPKKIEISASASKLSTASRTVDSIQTKSNSSDKSTALMEQTGRENRLPMNENNAMYCSRALPQVKLRTFAKYSDSKREENEKQGLPEYLNRSSSKSSSGDMNDVNSTQLEKNRCLQVQNSDRLADTVASSAHSDSNSSSGNKKTSKVEITLKSATLPRRKTSKAEIKLDLNIPRIAFKTEIEHVVNAPASAPTAAENKNEESPVVGATKSYRSWSLESDNVNHRRVSAHECIIPIMVEQGSRRNSFIDSRTSTRPPMYPFQAHFASQTQRSSQFPHQISHELKSEVAEPIKKSPREYIIPIAVEGGGYVTPRAGSLEPSSSGFVKSKLQKFTTPGLKRCRRLGSQSDNSEDEDRNILPLSPQHHVPLRRGRDLHHLRSSKPRKYSVEANDSLSSADDDDDDDGFEILTAESLFSTLLSRVRSLTQRLTVEDGRSHVFPPNHFLNQLRNVDDPSTSCKKKFGVHRKPLSSFTLQ